MSRGAPTLRLQAAYVGLAALDTWLAGRRGTTAHRARRVTKPLLMPVLASSLAADPRAEGSPLRTTTLLAEAAGWAGDVALLRHGTGPFAVGAGAFGVGHAAYISGFLRQRGDRSRLPVGAAALAWALTTPAMVRGAARQEPVLGPAVAAYSALLAGMVADASQLDPALPRAARRLSVAGAGLFMASDTVLGARSFLLADPPAWLERVVMGTYTAAQLLLSEGAARAA